MDRTAAAARSAAGAAVVVLGTAATGKEQYEYRKRTAPDVTHLVLLIRA
jgi:hypothetical protein